jgi:hypothetical protein
MSDGETFTLRGGKTVRADEVFHAWTSGNLGRMRKALAIKTHPIDRHFLLMGIVDQTYKARADRLMAETCLQVGRIHLAEFPQLVPSLLQEFNNLLPRVLTFQLLPTLLAERGQFDEAIQICESAIGYGLHDGTKGDYPGRMERLRKLRAKAVGRGTHSGGSNV